MEKINANLTVNEGDWRQLDDYVCRACGDAAYSHPQTNQIWGCKTCVFSTYSIYVYFKEKDDAKARWM